MKNRVIALVGGMLLLLFSSLSAQAPDTLWTRKHTPKPPLSLARVGGELVAGTAGGVVLGMGLIIGVGSLVESLDPSDNSSSSSWSFHFDEHFERNAAITIGC